MNTRGDLEVFLNPRSVAVIGATERPGSWGSFIMEGLLSRPYAGSIYPVNHQTGTVYGLPAYKDVRDIKGPVDLAILTIPENSVEEVIESCGLKKVKGVTIITAGYGEALESGMVKQAGLAHMARSYGMRLLGPNVSGTFNLHAQFNGAASPEKHLICNSLGAVCQGGYAFYDLLAWGSYRGMGVGKFIHTGNECDLTVTDFLDHFGKDREVEGIIMYLEAVRDGNRFLQVAGDVSKTKPVVVYKAGKTPGASRAARSHTGALSGMKDIYEGAFHQTHIIISPSMEMLLPLGHALIERPPMKGDRVAVVTMGGSWGVALVDALEEAGLHVPELSRELQKSLRSLGMPVRASTKNPVDIGASGLFFEADTMLAIGREIAFSGEVDAMILHGMARPGMLEKEPPTRLQLFLDINKKIIRGYQAMEKEAGIPVLMGSTYAPLESQVVYDMNREGIRTYERLYEMSQLLSLMREYNRWRQY